jgi:Lipocalin-like domain
LEGIVSRDIPEVVGVWILRSLQLENPETGQRIDAYGPNPRGVLILHPDGRMAAVITPRDQAVPITEADKVAAFQNLVAYSGRYRLDPPDLFVTVVDVSWFQPWIGTEQPRTYKISGDTLDIITPPTRTSFAKGLWTGTLSWIREGSAAAHGPSTGG